MQRLLLAAAAAAAASSVRIHPINRFQPSLNPISIFRSRLRLYP